MKIKYHKRFEKRFKKLNEKDKKKVISIVEVFINNPLDKRLKNHSLKGDLLGLRAISVRSDLRIVFQEFDGYTLVIFLDVGTHGVVYS